MIKVVVTGSDGQLGKTFAEVVSGLDFISFDFKKSKELDIADGDRLQDTFENEHYDFCINCAAYTNVEQAEKYPDLAYQVNAKGVKNLAEVCKKHHTTLIHISTDYVFDGKKDSGYTVEDKTNPINVYGKSKLAGEKFIQQIQPNHYIIRTSWLYSKKYGHNFYRTILNKALAGEDLYVTDAQTGCPTNAESLAKFILNEIVLEEKPFGTYHFTDGKPMTWHDFAEQILKENGLTDKVNLVLDSNYRTLAKRPNNSVLL
ncbi:dTDP-4-dehydrorhamnose reductase [Muricauda brasiliensis]|uniref:dTDP-4-dehydrorhamnose reductase n=1 Tax=Muricauda brasiliensis TaxID=2162892 RepID=UPI000D3951DA|nr:dTDP-4-dehydrorhamnose reductase [Muricauda brasiliensis]